MFFQDKPAILVAEDNSIISKVTQNTLDKLGYQSSVVSNGHLALEMLKNHSKSYLVTLMDFQMPEMGGLEATHKLRQQGFDSERWPIIGYTDLDDEEVVPIAHTKGMNDVLQKPAKPSQLQQTLNHFVLMAQKYRAAEQTQQPVDRQLSIQNKQHDIAHQYEQQSDHKPRMN